MDSEEAVREEVTELLLIQDRDDGSRGFFQFATTNPAGCVEYDPGIGGEQPIGPNATWLIEATGIEIGGFKRD